MKKRLCSFVLAAILLVASVPGASASNITTPEQMYALAENEIQATMEVVMNDVYQQLDAQDALVLLDLYRQILEPEIRADVMEKYGLSAVSTETTRISGQKTYSLPYGGVITYLSEFDDYAPTEVVATYLDRDRAYDYIFLGKNDTTTDTDFVVGTIIQEAVGNIPYVSGIANIKTPCVIALIYLIICNINTCTCVISVVGYYLVPNLFTILTPFHHSVTTVGVVGNVGS